MTYIPNADKPSEIDVIWAAIQKLRRSEIVTGKWDAEGLSKWVKTELLPVEEALERLEEQLEVIYPGIEISDAESDAA